MDEHLRARRPDLAIDPAQHEEEREEDHRTWPGKGSLTDALASQPRGRKGSGWPGRSSLVNAYFSPAASALPASMRAELAKQYGGPSNGAREHVRAQRTRVASELAVQRKESGENDGAVDDVHEAAREGISGSSGALPFLDQIQRSFGEHDISDVRAHTDSAAAKGAKRMSAEAYATGNRIVFAGAPTLHTAAHEAAHVVQQRANVQLQGGVGKAGDSFEKHADAVADRVVQGKSAVDLLNVFGSRNSSAPTRVQLKPDDKAAKPTDKTKAKGEIKPKLAAPEVMPPQEDPAARHLTMEQASDPNSAKDVDTEWIDSLPKYVQAEIDGAFSDKAAGEAVDKAAKTDAGLKTIETETNAAIAALKAETRTRLQNGNAKARISETQVTADAIYQKGLQSIADLKTQRIATRKAELSGDHDASMGKGDRAETVVEPPTKKIKRAEGKAIARANFISWAIGIFGSADAVKTHFQGIEQVDTKSHSDMWLSKEAAARFRLALKDFEDNHEGQTIVRTGTAMQSRHLHEGRQGLGMDGHALGIAFDLHAGQNPNIKYQPHKSDPADSYDYLLRTFGADAAGNKGRARMSLSPSAGHKSADASIEDLGNDTVAKKPHEANDMGNKAGDQYDEMFKTSENFKSNNAAMTAELRDVRDFYRDLNLDELKKAHAGLVKSQKQPQIYAAQKLKVEGFKGTKEETAKRVEEITRELAVQIHTSNDDIVAKEGQVKERLKAAFGDWLKQIQTDEDADDAQIATNTSSMNGMDALTAQLTAFDATSPTAMDDLASFATQNRLTLKEQLTEKQQNPKAYKAKLLKDLEANQKNERARITMKGSVTTGNTGTEWAQNEKAVLERWKQRLSDPKVVFGTSKGKDAEGHWTTDVTAENVALMQLLEKGFVEKSTKVAAPGKGREEVFNREVVETLVRFGFSPGATYGDTMHFDFIEGSSLATKGGRSNANMSQKRFGPLGKKGPAE